MKKKVREQVIRKFSSNISKARHFIGWEPKINSKDGILSMLEWTRSLLNEKNNSHTILQRCLLGTVKNYH